MSNKWLEHVKQFRKTHPKMSYKDALSEASKTYKKLPSDVSGTFNKEKHKTTRVGRPSKKDVHIVLKGTKKGEERHKRKKGTGRNIPADDIHHLRKPKKVIISRIRRKPKSST